MSWNLQLTKFVINCTRGRSHNATKTAFYLHIPENNTEKCKQQSTPVKHYNKTRLKIDSNSLLKHSSYVKNILFLFLEPFESLILKFCTKECSSLKSFWRLKFPPFSKKNKNIQTFESRCIGKWKQLFKQPFSVCHALHAAELLELASLVRCMSYRDFFRRTIKLKYLTTQAIRGRLQE